MVKNCIVIQTIDVNHIDSTAIVNKIQITQLFTFYSIISHLHILLVNKIYRGILREGVKNLTFYGHVRKEGIG